MGNSFTLVSRKVVLKKLNKFPKAMKNRIEKVMLILKETPIPHPRYDVKKMRGYTHVYRIRIGKLRIIYQINFRKRVIKLLDIDYRGKIYKEL